MPREQTAFFYMLHYKNTASLQTYILFKRSPFKVPLLRVKCCVKNKIKDKKLCQCNNYY